MAVEMAMAVVVGTGHGAGFFHSQHQLQTV
jgi:hypothetical protein